MDLKSVRFRIEKLRQDDITETSVWQRCFDDAFSLNSELSELDFNDWSHAVAHCIPYLTPKQSFELLTYCFIKSLSEDDNCIFYSTLALTVEPRCDKESVLSLVSGSKRKWEQGKLPPSLNDIMKKYYSSLSSETVESKSS